MAKNIISMNISGAAKLMQDLPLREKISMVRHFGLNAIELHPYREWSGGLFNLSGRELKATKSLFAGLDGISIHAPMGDTPSVKDAQKRAEAIQGIRDSLRAGAFIGATVAVVHCRAAYIETDEDEKIVAEIYHDLGDYAEALGLLLAVETSTDLTSTQKFLRIIDAISHDNVGATIDTGHLLRCLTETEKQSENLPEIYNEIVITCTRELLRRGKLFHVHLNDVRVKNLWDHYGMGLGFVDFPRFFRTLVEGGYEGMLAMEIHRGDSDETGCITMEEMQSAVNFVKQELERARAVPASD